MISIVTLTRDRWDLMESCMKSVKAQQFKEQIEWIIVDNGSEKTQWSAWNMFRDQWAPNVVKFIKHDNSGSFASMSNLGARESTGDIILFLNNDVQILTPIPYIRHIMQCPEVGVLGGVLMFPDKRLQSAGVIMQENACPANLGVRAVDKLGLDPQKVDPTKWGQDAMSFRGVSGALMAMRREVFEKAKGFDESFPWAFEDVDICLRIMASQGLHSFTSTHVAAIHDESSSKSTHDVDLSLLAFRGRWGHRVFADYDRFI